MTGARVGRSSAGSGAALDSGAVLGVVDAGVVDAGVVEVGATAGGASAALVDAGAVSPCGKNVGVFGSRGTVVRPQAESDKTRASVVQ
jgi:hypothetical protein